MKINKKITAQVFDGEWFDDMDEAIAYCNKHRNTFAFKFYYKLNMDDSGTAPFQGYVLINENNIPYTKAIWGAEYWAHEKYNNRIYYGDWGYGDAEERWRLEEVPLTEVHPDYILYWRKEKHDRTD